MELIGLNFSDPPEPEIAYTPPGAGIMESWRWVWRQGVQPLLSDRALKALRRGLASNDSALVQRQTAVALNSCLDSEPCIAACAIGYAGWEGEGLETVGDVDEFLWAICLEVDKRLGESGAIRWFLNWFDDAPREVVFAALLGKVDAELSRRGVPVPAVA